MVASFGGRVAEVVSTGHTHHASPTDAALSYAVTVIRDDGLAIRYEGIEELAVRPGIVLEREALLGHLPARGESSLTLRARRGEIPLVPANLVRAPRPLAQTRD